MNHPPVNKRSQLDIAIADMSVWKSRVADIERQLENAKASFREAVQRVNDLQSR